MVVVHIDTHGPVDTLSLTNSQYGVAATDGYSGFTVYTAVRTKDQIPAAVKGMLSNMATISGRPLQFIRTDNGTEYCNKQMAEFLQSLEPPAMHTTSAPYTPQQNGTAESKIGTLKARARAMLVHAGVPMTYWEEAMRVACHTYNRLTSSRNRDPNKSPFELFCGKQPSVSHLRVFGCAAYAQVPSALQRGFEPISRAGILVGYEGGHSTHPHAYRVALPDGKIITSTNVVFNESYFPQKGGSDTATDLTGSWLDDEPAVIIGGTGNKAEGKAMRAPAAAAAPGGGSDFITAAEAFEQPALPLPPAAPLRRTLRANAGVAPERLVYNRPGEPGIERPGAGPAAGPVMHDNPLFDQPIAAELALISLTDGTVLTTGDAKQLALVAKMAKATQQTITFEPTSFKQAMGSSEGPKWRLATDKEFNSLLANKTWTLVDRPRLRKVIPCKWVFKVKPDGTFKARLVVKGFHQREGIDYAELFAPVSSYNSLRVLMALAAHEDCEIIQLDISSAFLHGELEEEIYMEQPEGYAEGGSGKVCLLRKALYGLKQAPRQWWHRLKQKLTKLGFTPIASDPSLYVRREADGSTTILASFVDDLLIVGPTGSTKPKEVKAELEKEFALTEGDMSRYVGFEIERDRAAGTITLSQHRQILDLVDKYGLSDAKPRSVPMAPGSKISKEGTPLDREEHTFAELVGSLNWLANTTRADVPFSVNQLSRYLQSPTKEHWATALGVLRYLKGTASYGLTYSRTASPVPSAFCDADWGANIDDRHSITGYTIIMAGAAVAWGSKKQASVALSTAEAEYMAACRVTKELTWLNTLLTELGRPPPLPITVWSDNQAAIKLTKDPVSSQKTKHIDIQYHFTREQVEAGTVTFSYVPSREQVADCLTKPVSEELFKMCRAGMGLTAGRAM